MEKKSYRYFYLLSAPTKKNSAENLTASKQQPSITTTKFVPRYAATYRTNTHCSKLSSAQLLPSSKL